jgi:hypothetical protein
VRAQAVIWLMLALGLAGCGRSPDGAAATGAREAAQAFFEAIRRQDWSAAYAGLDGDRPTPGGEAAFASRAERYRKGLGFEPEQVQVSACEEQGPRAVAHVALAGQAGGHWRRFRDTVWLRRHEDGWRVEAPPSFSRLPPSRGRAGS